jgi:hypothetical protein
MKTKRFLSSAVIAILAMASLIFSQETEHQEANSEQRAKVAKLIEQGVESKLFEGISFKYKEGIQKEASQLSSDDKKVLYDQYRKEALKHVLLNTAPIFGIGSYTQGDIASGVIVSICDALGWVAFLSSEGKDAELAIALTSFGIGRIIGWMLPPLYQSQYNKELRKSLNYYDFAYSIDPLIVPKDGTPAIGLAFNLRY